jgi:hypothetical protein
MTMYDFSSRSTRSPRPSQTLLNELFAAAFAVVETQADGADPLDDLVSRISLTVLAWMEDRGLKNEALDEAG